MADSKQNDGDRDDPLLMLDQFMDFLKKNTMQFSIPSLEKINTDTGEIESMGRRAESLGSLKGPSPDRKRPSVSERKNSSILDRRSGPGLDRDRSPISERRNAKGLAGNIGSVPERKEGADPDVDPEKDPDRGNIPGLDFISALIPEKMKVKITDVDDDPDRNRARSLAGFSVPIPDSKRIKDDVDEIEKIADRLELLLNESETAPVVEQKKMVSSRDRFIFSLKRSVPPIFASLALMAYAVVVLRVVFGWEIPRLIEVVADPNYIFLVILILLLITLIVNSLRRYRIHMKVRKMQLNVKTPEGKQLNMKTPEGKQMNGKTLRGMQLNGKIPGGEAA